jgi:hypothetical protein
VANFLNAVGVRQLLIAFGFGCDCPDEQLYQDVPLALDHLQSFIAEAEAANFYRVGKDNLHVKDLAGRAEFLFCHESDIHFISENTELVERLKAEWLGEGYCNMFVHLGTEWRTVGSPREQITKRDRIPGLSPNE